LGYQGGKMSAEEAEVFETDPDFNTILLMHL